MEYSIILLLIILSAVITNATQHQYSSPGLLSLPMSESSRSFAPSVNHLPSATSSYDGLQGVCILSLSLRRNYWCKIYCDIFVLSIYVHSFQPSNPATELQNEGILSSQYIAENQQSQQNRTTNKKKKEIVEISIDQAIALCCECNLIIWNLTVLSQIVIDSYQI